MENCISAIITLPQKKIYTNKDWRETKLMMVGSTREAGLFSLLII